MRVIASLLVASALAGCALTLDYAPPEQRVTPHDAGLDAARSRADGSAIDAASVDAPFTSDAITAQDAIVRIDAMPIDGASVDAARRARGDCDTNADCTPGTCVELLAGGYRVCRTPPVQSMHCDSSRLDLCCSSADCGTGMSCFLGPVHPICAGATRNPANECAADECASDADCPSGICAAAGTLAPVATCLDAVCLHDDDCTEELGGTCVLLRDPCCALPLGLVCTYPSDGCVRNADCATGHCEDRLGRARCVTGPALCPG